MQPKKITLILLGVTLAAFVGLGALPSTRIAYHQWQRDRSWKAVSTGLTGSKLSDAEQTRLVHTIDYHQRQLVELGYTYEGRFTLEKLKGNHEAFARLHRDFSAANRSRTATCQSSGAEGTFVVWDDEPANQARWEKFVAEHDTAEFAASTTPD